MAKVSEIFVTNPARPVRALPLDAQDISALQARLIALADEINAMAGRVAQARAVREYDSDRRKRLLAGEMRQHLLDKHSASSAEALARSSEDYAKGLDYLQDELTTAETIIQSHEAKRIAFEAARSALSSAKHAIDTY